MQPRIALTSGEPAGIGPELCAQIAAARSLDCSLTCFGDRELLAARAGAAGVAVHLQTVPAADSSERRQSRGCLYIAHEPLAVPSIAGRPDPANSRYVLRLLDRALDGIAAGQFDALVTAPVQKSVINDAGVPFTGHTEYLAAKTGAGRPVMMLVAGRLRVALATVHLPLREVSQALTLDGLVALIKIIDRDVRSFWGLARPRIAVCGLNPHAGESGHLGDEEIVTIAPAIALCRSAGVDVSGPVPADTVFVPREAARYDVIVAMYHDQGLPALKQAGFGQAVNVTLGLPILRTSVDHGTALDLAGTGRADAGSLSAAIDLAIDLVHRRKASLPQRSGS